MSERCTNLLFNFEITNKKITHSSAIRMFEKCNTLTFAVFIFSVSLIIA